MLPVSLSNAHVAAEQPVASAPLPTAKYPSSVRELQSRFNLSALRADKIHYRESQVEAVTRCLDEPASFVLMDGTGNGKTVVGLMVASAALSRGERVLWVTYTRELVTQTADRAREFLTLAEDAIAQIEGGTAAKRREALYADSERRLLISTPVARNDIGAGILKLAGISLVVIDEGHEGKGDHPVRYLMDECRAAQVPCLVMSATIAENWKDTLEILDRVGAGPERFFNPASPQGARAAIPVVAPFSDMRRGSFDALRVAAGDLHSYGTIVAHALREMTQYVPEKRGEILSIAACNEAGVAFASPKRMSAVSTEFQLLMNRDLGRYGQTYSLLCELGMLRYYHDSILMEGRLPFLIKAAEDILDARRELQRRAELTKAELSARGPKDKISDATLRMLESPEFRRAFITLADNTFFLGFLERDLGRMWSFFCEGSEYTADTRDLTWEQMKRLILRGALMKAVRETPINHPGELAVTDIIATHLKRNRNDRYLVWVGSKELTIYYAARIEHEFKDLVVNPRREKVVAVPFCGGGFLSSRERTKNIERFRTGEANVLVATRAAELGHDIPNANVSIELEMALEAVRIEQRRGRAGRQFVEGGELKRAPGFHYRVHTPDTPHDVMVPVGDARHARMKRGFDPRRAPLFTGQ